MDHRRDPSVCAVCITANRPDMLARAIRCFQRQTYRHKGMLVLDSSYPLLERIPVVDHVRVGSLPGVSIGGLRNLANQRALADILIHFDDDDWSHPNRMAEQVAFLIESKKQIVGYREMLFAEIERAEITTHSDMSRRYLISSRKAWLYRHNLEQYALGTSFCYWREIWERKPFADKGPGEDETWRQGLESIGISSLWNPEKGTVTAKNGEPRMIATIHGANVSSRVVPESTNWERRPEWDEPVRKLLEET